MGLKGEAAEPWAMGERTSRPRQDWQPDVGRTPSAGRYRSSWPGADLWRVAAGHTTRRPRSMRLEHAYDFLSVVSRRLTIGCLAKSTLLAVLLMAALYGCGGSSPVASSAPAATQPPNSAAAPGSRPRDLETYLVLFDLAAYKSKVSPAFDKYVDTGDTAGVRDLLPGIEVPELADRKKRAEAALKLATAVVEARCVVKLPGVDPYQLGSSELASYLFSASDRLRETVTSKDISDETLEYPLGEHTEIIRPVEIAEIRGLARNVPVPDDAAMRKQLAAFHTMMDAAGRKPDYALALVMK